MTTHKVIETWAAREFGADVALVLNEAISWNTYAIKMNWHFDGTHYWFQHTRKQWSEDLDWISLPSILRYLKVLLDAGLIVVRRNEANYVFYRINEDLLEQRRLRVQRRAKPYSDLNPPESQGALAQTLGGADQIDPSAGGGTRISVIRPSDLPDPTSLYLEKQIEKQIIDVRAAPVPLPEAKPKSRTRKKTPEGDRTIGSKVWESYGLAYLARYSRPPKRNAKQNSLCTQLADRLGDDAPAVAAFYVSHARRHYVEALHPLGLCVRDAEALHTQWETGRQMTETFAKKVDTAGEGEAMLDRAEERYAAKYGGGNLK